jgi:hypothetical protein
MNNTNTNQIVSLRAEYVRDFYLGIVEGWDSWTMDQIGAAIVALTAILPPELK